VSDLATWHRAVVSGEARGAGAARVALSAAALGYRAVCAVRNGLYNAGSLRIARVERPVVSVGNLTLGGTGKTPMVEHLASELSESGLCVAILSRGYGSEPGQPNDEAMLLAANLPHVPHLQGKDRVTLAGQACEDGRQVLILDDGFQHRRLARDLDIVLIDCLRPFGFGRLFPRGLLREPIGNLCRADLLVATRADLASADELNGVRRRVRDHGVDKPWVHCAHAPDRLEAHDGRRESLDTLRGRNVAAFAGIGNAEAFWRTVRSTDCRLVGVREFADHHRYTPEDMAEVARWASGRGAEMLLTTQKDLVKLNATEIDGLPLWALRIQLQILSGADVLEEQLDRIRSLASRRAQEKP
jgi:tetraacyldisaccharide 4'-kinase